MLDAVRPKVASRKFLSNDKGRPRVYHLSSTQHSSIGVIEWKRTVYYVVWKDTRKHHYESLHSEVSDLSHLACLGQSSGP